MYVFFFLSLLMVDFPQQVRLLLPPTFLKIGPKLASYSYFLKLLVTFIVCRYWGGLSALLFYQVLPGTVPTTPTLVPTTN